MNIANESSTKGAIFSLITATLLCSPSSASQESTAQSLDAVNVTASAERDDLDLNSTSNLYRIETSGRVGTQVITQREIEAYEPKDFFDLLDKAIGVDMTYHGRKHPYFINIRGGGNVTYILDGAILPSTADRILQKLPMNAIEEIQVVRGSTALSLAPSIGIGASNSGSGINTAFVIIRTKQPKGTEGTLTGYMEKAVSQLSANGQSLYLGTKLGSQNSPAKGYISGMASRYDRPSKDSWFDGSNADSGMINGGLNIGRFSLNVMGYKDSGSFEMQRGVKTDGTIDTSKWYYDPLKTSILSTDMSMKWNEDQITLFSFGKTNYKQTEINENFANTSYAEKHYEEDTKSYSLRHNATFGNTLIQLGGQLSSSKGFGPNLSKKYNNFDTDIKGWSASVEQKLFDGKVILDAGYRRDLKHIKYSSTDPKNDNANNDVDLAPATIIAAGALWHINNIFTLSGRYFKGDEGTSGDFDLLTENSAPLHPEKQDRIEIALEAAVAPYFKPTVTWFDVDIKNQKTATDKTYTDAAGNEYYYYAESDSHRKGIELALKGYIGIKTNYLFGWTHMFNNSNTVNGIKTDAIGVESPENSFTALLSHSWDGYRANISAKRIDKWSQSTSAMGLAANVNLGGYTRIDANIEKDFVFNNYIATGKIYGRNLGNEKYSTRYTTGYYYDRGRTIGTELSFAF
ncbi:MAG: TonB-dependent receptor plug domain-containing protein [Sulfurovaceae bacterium]